LAVELTFAVAKPVRQAAHAVSIDDAVGDEPHGPTDEIGPRVPLGRAG
jgi:hypothetical protein